MPPRRSVTAEARRLTFPTAPPTAPNEASGAIIGPDVRPPRAPPKLVRPGRLPPRAARGDRGRSARQGRAVRHADRGRQELVLPAPGCGRRRADDCRLAAHFADGEPGPAAPRRGAERGDADQLDVAGRAAASARRARARV